MILTGPAIKTAVRRGHIVLDPFDVNDINPNSYNFHLAETVLVPSGDEHPWRKITVSPDGFLLLPHIVYLGTTLETIGSSTFVTLLLGRSSVGRLGLFVNITADLGHLGSSSNWTLELTVIQPLRIYPRMTLGQVSFWLTDEKSRERYCGRYHNDTMPTPNRDQRITESDK